MTKVKVPSSHYNQVISYLENAVFSRFHNPSMTGAAMNRLRAFVARDLDLDVKLPLTEVRWHYQVSLGTYIHVLSYDYEAMEDSLAIKLDNI